MPLPASVAAGLALAGTLAGLALPRRPAQPTAETLATPLATAAR